MRSNAILKLVTITLALTFLTLQVPAFTAAFTVQSTSIRTVKKPRASQERKRPISFIAWKGDRLITTAGTFIIDESVAIVDTAGSKEFMGGFKGKPPSVRLLYENKRLVKVVIY